LFSRKRIPTLLRGILMLTVVATAVGAMFLVWNGYHSVYVQPGVYSAPPLLTFRAARKVYPYSIIPGGVYDAKELEKSIQLDPFLAEHYRDIHTENLVAVRTQAPMQAYVSFLKDGHICWTGKKIAIPRGELLLTDGQHMIRSRCGNRILLKRSNGDVHSEFATDETQDLMMDTPMPSLAKLPPHLQPELPPGVAGADTWKDPASQPSPVPEPEVLTLFGSGVFFILMAALHRE
jgi:hypothetical protein